MTTRPDGYSLLSIALHWIAAIAVIALFITHTEEGLYRANPGETLLLQYYANSIAHLRKPAAKSRKRGAGKAGSQTPVRPEALLDTAPRASILTDN